MVRGAVACRMLAAGADRHDAGGIAPIRQHRVIAPMAPFDPGAGVVLREPERPALVYWAGCPAVLYEPGAQRVLLTYRQRRPQGTHGDRGWRPRQP